MKGRVPSLTPKSLSQFSWFRCGSAHYVARDCFRFREFWSMGDLEFSFSFLSLMLTRGLCHLTPIEPVTEWVETPIGSIPPLTLSVDRMQDAPMTAPRPFDHLRRERRPFLVRRSPGGTPSCASAFAHDRDDARPSRARLRTSPSCDD